MSNIWDCEYYLRCQNNKKCLTCGPEQRLLKLPEDKNRKKYQAKAKQNTITKMDDNTGQTLEEYILANLNNLPTVKEWQARRQAGSGNIWFMPGDVADSVLLVECKERSTVTAKGEKTISITKTMLDKIEQEAKTYGTYPALAFRFKGDTSGKTYIVNEFDVLCDMVHEIKHLRYQEELLQKEKAMYKEVADELYKEVQALKKRLGEK